MNSITIHGRLTRDPEVKTYTTKKGDEGKICNFTVAVDRSFGDETDFFDCQAFGKKADVIEKFFFKGKEIVVNGSMQCDPYEAKDGSKRYPWRLHMNEFDFCGSKSDSAPAASASEPVPEFKEIPDEDIPF